jgi:hypothetical protein
LNQPNVFNTLFNPLHVQQFQRYLPTAFDEGMTLLEKVNKIIVTLNRIGKLSNDVLDQWNQVMDWVMSDGLDASVDAKIEAMLADGTFEKIINQDIFNDLNNQIQQLFTNVKHYGAVGDGVTDDTPAINSAIASIASTGGILFFPTGRYKVTSTITLPVGISIKGVSMAKSVIYYTGNGSCITFPNGQTNWTWGYIQDILFEGTPSGTTALYINNTEEGHLERVNFKGFGIGGIEFYESYSTKINDCRFEGMQYGVKMNSHANALYYNGCQFNGQLDACAIVGSGLSISFDHCNFENANAGVRYLDGAFLDSLIIRDSYCENLPNGLFYVPTMTSGRIFSFLIEKCMHMGMNTDQYAVKIDSGVNGGAVRGDIISLDVFDCTDSAIHIIGNDSRIHTENVRHWNYTTWAEKKVFSDTTSQDVSGITRTWRMLNFRGDVSVPSLTFASGTLPPADVAYRGKIIFVQNGVGVADHIYICLKNSSDGYGWFDITTTVN